MTFHNYYLTSLNSLPQTNTATNICTDTQAHIKKDTRTCIYVYTHTHTHTQKGTLTHSYIDTHTHTIFTNIHTPVIYILGDGTTVGQIEIVGSTVGRLVGFCVGVRLTLGALEGKKEGEKEGPEGRAVGVGVGALGFTEGSLLGWSFSSTVGAALGAY